MSIASLQHTLTGIGASQVSSESLSNPLGRTFDKILNVLTMGIYGAYKESVASEMKNDLLDLGKAIMSWDPQGPDTPVKLTLGGEDYEISDMPHGGIRLQQRPGGACKEIDGVSLSALRDMIFSDLMNHRDFSAAMDRRIYEDTTVHVDMIGMKQERANACGEACRNMILSYHVVDYDPATNSRALFEGNTKEELVTQLRKNGLAHIPLLTQDGNEKAYTCEQIQESLKRGPLLCELEGHYIIVHGANAMLGRVDVYCPLLGNRCASLDDFNAHLDWEQDYREAPLMQFEKMNAAVQKPSAGFGKSTDENFSPGIIDQLGVSVLVVVSSIGNSWLKLPEQFVGAQ